LFSTPRFKYTFSIPGKYEDKRKNKQRESDIIMHKTMAGRKRKGFSLVEILIVLVILAVISGGGMMIAGKSSEKAKYVTAQKDLDIIQQAFIQYYNVEGTFTGIAPGALGKVSPSAPGERPYRVLQSFVGKPLADWKDPWGVEYQIQGTVKDDGTGVLIVYCKYVNDTGTSVDATVGSENITGIREDKISNANGKPMPMYRIIYNVDF
jgi:general secretion pathway protein G